MDLQPWAQISSIGFAPSSLERNWDLGLKLGTLGTQGAGLRPFMGKAERLKSQPKNTAWVLHALSLVLRLEQYFSVST